MSLKELRLEASFVLKRRIRKDPPHHLGYPTWDLLEEAIREGKSQEALALVDYLHYAENEVPHVYFYCNWMRANWDYVGDNFGDEALVTMFTNAPITMFREEKEDREEREEMEKESSPGRVVGFPPELLKMENLEELIKRNLEMLRGHSVPAGSVEVIEEPDRYVLNIDCCGVGTRMLRAGMAEEPWNIGLTKEPHPWSWGKEGVPYYCIHCCLERGINATNIRGFPLRVHEVPGHDYHPDVRHPNNPCRMIFYKRPELIPEEYFKVMGLKKNPSRFKPAPTDKP